MQNKYIRELIKRTGLKHWQVADALGISAGTFCVHLRHELPDSERAEVEQAIQKLTEGKLANA